MNKLFFVGFLVLILAFSGCSEEPTGNAIINLNSKEKADNKISVSSDAGEPECNDNESRPCVALEDCQGIQHCSNGVWLECKDVPNDGCPRIQDCIEEWECQEWGPCTKGIQTRKCIDSHECNTEFDKLDTIQLC